MPYDPTNLGTDEVDQRVNTARFLAGDTDNDHLLLTDDEWRWLLTSNSDDVYLAAAGALERDASRLDEEVVTAKTVGDLTLQYERQEKASIRRQRAAELRRKAPLSATSIVPTSAYDGNDDHDGFRLGEHDWT